MYHTPYILHDPVRSLTLENYVTGRDRPMYFKRPLVPQMQDVPVHVSQPPPQQNQQEIITYREEVEIESNMRDKEIQTDYRENETQTNPYTPKYVVKEGDRHEVMQLEHLKWGTGLPASIDELEQIEYEREKDWFENSLAPISDEASFNLRRKLMEDQELRTWNKKEQEIKKHQNEKLYLLQSSLIQREKEVEDKNAQRIEEIKVKKTEQKNRLIAKIQRRKIKVLRKMLKNRKAIDQDDTKRQIIEEYADFASKVYAGISREGLSLDKIANKYEVQPVALTTFNGISELSQNINPKVMQTQVQVKKHLHDIKNSYTRAEKYHRLELNKAQLECEGQNKIDEKKTKEEDQNQFSQKQLKYKIRPPTPTWKYDEKNNNQIYLVTHNCPIDLWKKESEKRQGDDKRNKAVFLLQRLIRGRAKQNIMYNGKEKRLALIDELLTVAMIEELPLEQQDEYLMKQHEERFKNAILESLQGEIISETLDQLSKELLRIKQERKIAKMVEVAENDRRTREIEEAGKRQAEELLRAKEDVLYNECMRVHQGTVDSYLDWIMNNTCELASTRQATIMANLRKEKMNQPLEQFERKYNANETIIKDLVHSFLIPNVQRSKLMRQIGVEEKRFSEAAKKSLNSTLTKSAVELKGDKVKE